MFSFTIPPSSQPRLVSEVLRQLNISLTLRRKLKKTEGAIFLNGHPISWETLIYSGDTLTVIWPSYCKIQPHPMPLNVCYEDDAFLVVDKPAGLLVHPTSGTNESTLANAVVHYLQDKALPSGFHPVHRLDRNTSGLLLIAKNPYCQHLLSVSSAKPILRDYLAVITGVPSPLSGIIDAPIGRLPGSIIERTVRTDGQTAITYYETIESFSSASLVKLSLKTGRTHQLRVHLSHIGHPILGDDLYGGSKDLINRQALHAASLQFTHPLTGEALKIVSPLPLDINSLLELLMN